MPSVFGETNEILPAQVRILPFTINAVLIEDHYIKTNVCLANTTLSNFYNVGHARV